LVLRWLWKVDDHGQILVQHVLCWTSISCTSFPKIVQDGVQAIEGGSTNCSWTCSARSGSANGKNVGCWERGWSNQPGRSVGRSDDIRKVLEEELCQGVVCWQMIDGGKEEQLERKVGKVECGNGWQ